MVIMCKAKDREIVLLLCCYISFCGNIGPGLHGNVGTCVSMSQREYFGCPWQPVVIEFKGGGWVGHGSKLLMQGQAVEKGSFDGALWISNYYGKLIAHVEHKTNKAVTPTSVILLISLLIYCKII